MSPEQAMRAAIEQARLGIAAGQSPFGSVIVRESRIVAAGHNEVWKRCDPTAHAEIVTIQRAAAALATFNLSGCELYSTCEPCPMCASAVHWARIDTVYFGACIDDANSAGFNELRVSMTDLYRGGGSKVRIALPMMARECAELFDEWKSAKRGAAY